MLRIGLTGGIGAGKSAVSAAFAQCGAIIVDGDVIAREVVQPGTAGLAALVEAFGKDILLPDGSLDRPALAAKAFRDDEARKKLNGIVHPLVGKRRSEIIAAVAEDAVVVEDIPLLVESGMAPLFPLVVIVNADPEVRVKRLIKRGMTESDARARIAARATAGRATWHVRRRRPRQDRRPGRRRAAPRRRRRLAGQLGQPGGVGAAGQRRME
jgi:dephospho-CoA kinase